jgi:hypothetical protein
MPANRLRQRASSGAARCFEDREEPDLSGGAGAKHGGAGESRDRKTSGLHGAVADAMNPVVAWRRYAPAITPTACRGPCDAPRALPRIAPAITFQS